MEPERIARLMLRRGAMRASRKRLAAQITALEMRIKALDEELQHLDRVTELYRGHPLNVLDCGIAATVELVGGDRGAAIYRNAHNRRFWGINTWVGFGPMERRGSFLGSGWPTRRRAMEVAREWAALGKLPKQDEIDRNWRR